MSKKILKITTFLISFILIVDMFFYCSMTVYAFPARLKDGTWIDKPWSEAAEEIWLTIQYGLSQIGVFFTNGADFRQWLKNTEAYQDLWDENGRLAKNVSIDTETGNVIYSKEIMTVLKSAVDDYVKEENSKEENGGFYLMPTTDFTKVSPDRFLNAQQYRTFRNIIVEKGCLAVRIENGQEEIRFVDPFSDPDHLIQLVADVSSLNTWQKYPYIPVSCYFFCANDWEKHIYQIRKFPESDKIYESIADAVDYETSFNTSYQFRNSAFVNWSFEKHGSIGEDFTLYSVTGEKVRVFVSELAAKNYSVGNRKVFLTENYYNYEPEELKVSIDELEKTVDDLQKVIDELLKKIKDNTSEKEIMDLLKQILDALRDQQGTGGGGSGGGDVNVDIDLSTTNGLLSKILSKVTQIFDKMSETVEGATDAAWEKIQDTLDEILKQIKKIKHWTVADTLIDGVTGLSDMITDWVTLIGDLLEDLDGGAETTVAAISSTMDDATKLLKTKFPFCIPWDIAFLVTFLSHEPEVPVFNLPIKIESVGIDECIVVDLTDFSGISTISRTLLTLIYCYGLLNLTMKIMPMVKEET